MCGALYVAGALGLWRSQTRPGLDTRAGPILLSSVGIGLIGAGDRIWAISSVTATVTQLVTFVATGAGFSQAQPASTPWGGAFQRASVAIGFGWLSALRLRALRVQRPA